MAQKLLRLIGALEGLWLLGTDCKKTESGGSGENSSEDPIASLSGDSSDDSNDSSSDDSDENSND